MSSDKFPLDNLQKIKYQFQFLLLKLETVLLVYYFLQVALSENLKIESHKNGIDHFAS